MRQRADLRPYQERVARFLYQRNDAFGILKVGGGKTASALTAFVDLRREKHARHMLIVAPKRVAQTVWPAEVKAWEHTTGLRVRVADGGPVQRSLLFDAACAGLHDVTVLGVDNVQWLVDYVAQRKLPNSSPLFDLLVIDESSKFKSPKSARAKALARISNRWRIKWGLTGTPRPNSLLDLFTPAKIVTDGKLWGNSFYKWQENNFYTTDRSGYHWRPHPDAERRIMEEFSQIAITLQEHEMPQLPPITYLHDKVLMPQSAWDVYDEMEKELFTRVLKKRPDGTFDAKDIEAVSMAVATGKLAQIANGFLYAERGDPTSATAVHAVKIDWLTELVEELDGEPMIVVYEFQEDLRRILQAFPGTPYIGGNATEKGARAAIDDWNAGKLPLMVLHPASAGHGLNLQHGGSRMAWYSPCWSAEMWEQTIGRIYRPGQQRKVMVHVCCVDETVDIMKRLRVEGKITGQEALNQYLRIRSKERK